MEKRFVFMEKANAIATIYLNRPEKRNAISYGMWSELHRLLLDVENDDSVRALIIRGGDETSFAAGADIGEFGQLRSNSEAAREYNEKAYEVEQTLVNLAKPTIAFIQGYCIGAGCELALMCDLRFADSSGKFGITPAKLGIIYNLFGTKYLVDLIGPSKAKDILYSARIVEAEEALQMGLIDRLYSPEELQEKTYEYASLLAQNSLQSIGGAKRIINEIGNGMTEESEEIAELVLSSFDSEDYREGVSAFLEKRKPRFR